MSGHVIATAPNGGSTYLWTLHSFGERPSARSLRQLRRPDRRVKVFTSAEWDGLPYGERSDDWVYVGSRELWREADGVRR